MIIVTFISFADMTISSVTSFCQLLENQTIFFVEWNRLVVLDACIINDYMMSQYPMSNSNLILETKTRHLIVKYQVFAPKIRFGEIKSEFLLYFLNFVDLIVFIVFFNCIYIFRKFSTLLNSG